MSLSEFLKFNLRKEYDYSSVPNNYCCLCTKTRVSCASGLSDANHSCPCSIATSVSDIIRDNHMCGPRYVYQYLVCLARGWRNKASANQRAPARSAREHHAGINIDLGHHTDPHLAGGTCHWERFLLFWQVIASYHHGILGEGGFWTIAE